MAINYTWDCKTVDTKTINGNEDTVINVHWRLTGEDDANNDAEGNPQTATLYDTQELNTSDLSSFTAFADLTNEQITGWVESAMGAIKVQAKKDSLDAQINELVNPVVQTKTIGG
tara:strand:+ start:1301 stop:1645 length:345 start_codon:yes stop_codon:yes gene_type:complete